MSNAATALEGAPAIPATQGRRFNLRKEEILNAAGAVFNRHGLRDATLAVVAAEIGLNLKSLRHYYKRREDLVAAAFLRSIALHHDLALQAVEEEGVEVRVRRFVRSYFELQQAVREERRPEFVHFGDVRALTEPQATEVWSAYAQMFRAIRRLLRAPQLAWKPERLNAAAHMLLSQLLWSVVWISEYSPRDYPRVADRLTDLLLHGMARHTPTPFRSSLDQRASTPVSQHRSPDDFLHTATALINEFGYRGAGVDRISAELNVTKGSFYHHNDTRDGLVLACFERTFGLVRAAQDSALECGADGLMTVVAASDTLLKRQMQDDGALLRTSALTALAPDLRVRTAREMAQLTLRFEAMLSDGTIDGSVRPCDVRIAAEMVTALINSAAELRRWSPAATHENVADLYLTPLLLGLTAGTG